MESTKTTIHYSDSIKESLIIAIGLFFIFSSFVFVPFKKGPTSAKYFAPSREVVHFTFGYREVMADMGWLRALQDFDYCEEKINETDCKGKGWLYQVLDVVTELSPKFRVPYSAGGIALNVLVNDYDGASLLFDKAVVHFPTDWPILYRAAYHAIEYEKDQLKAANLMERAGRNGAPDWVFSLSTKLYTEGGRKEMGERLYNEMKEQGFSEHVLERMRKRLDGEKL